jgi:pSer/pThr/pTyr-binding forkhead associated (FHA) protein
MEVRFVFKSSSGKPRVHAKRLPILVGRSDASDVKLRIPKDSVSRRHCEFVLNEAGQVCVRDLESTNGTFVAERQLEPRVATPVPSGCLIKLGNVSFRVEYAAGSPEGSPHDSDTIPIDAAAEPPALEPAHDAEELEPVDPTLQASQSMSPPTGSSAAPAEVPRDLPAAEPAAEADFGFLAASEPEADAEVKGAWPMADEEPTAGGDQNLDDFFKGLS